LVAEDFRFVPDYVQVKSSPLVLSVYNAGRETHEFDSPILIYAAKTATTQLKTGSPGSLGIPIEPGQSLQIAVAPPPGTYLYICRRKGHANMTGTMLVE
jgi:plastocyanin